MKSLVQLENISKSFGGVHALIDVNLTVNPGEVHAVVGENGAGKSTLMKIISGALTPDKGNIFIQGNHVELSNPRAATKLGIAIVYQEPTFFPYLSVAENFFGGEELTSKLGCIDWRRMKQEAAKSMAEFGLNSRLLNMPMHELKTGDKQLILIAKAVYQKADLIILDEPTSILSQAETDILFKTIRRLQSLNKSVLYISHRLGEIFAISNRITVLRDGQVVGNMHTAEATEDQLIQMMSGRKIERSTYQSRNFISSTPMLEVSQLTLEPLFRNVSFQIKPGEIVGFYGLVGSGRSELARVIFGDLPIQAGNIKYKGKTIQYKSPKQAIKDNIAYLPEDRKQQGIFGIRSIGENMICVIMDRLSQKVSWLLNKTKERTVINRYVEELRIKIAGVEHPILSLSGGNQQKVVLGRWLAAEPDLIIMDEPTRGVDVGTKVQIHQLIRGIAEKGKAVMLISSELPEIFALSDRIIVMHEGDQVAALSREQTDEEAVLRWAIGLTEKSGNSPA
jgi:ABC-type sugar transport system ATPase subunit